MVDASGITGGLWSDAEGKLSPGVVIPGHRFTVETWTVGVETDSGCAPGRFTPRPSRQR
jgi:hypothetical protein